MAVNRYAALGLTDNPFPRIATVDPSSPNVRMNGSIFNDEIFKEQLIALRQRLDRRENLIYAQNTKFVAGVGKSALITREWRRIQPFSPEAAVFVRCGRGTRAETIDGVCNTIVETWLKNGALWKAFCGILRGYAERSPASDLDPGIVDSLISLHPKMPAKVSARALMLWDTRGTVDSITTWLEEQSPRVQRDIAADFLSAMLSEPRKFSDAYLKKTKRREVTAFITVLDLLRIGGVGYLYVFLDQFEELFHGRAKKQIHELASSMRQILEACPDLATIVVTLHPSAAMELRSADNQSLTTIAPVDDRHVVDLPNIDSTQAVSLARTYLDRFRLDELQGAGTSTPFDDECIEAIAAERDGNIRGILQTLHYCIESAVEQGARSIDKEYFQSHYRDITGQISERDLEL
jgi:hypothetical protein